MQHLADWILGLNPTLIMVVVGLLVFAEDAFFLGFVIPGETAAVLAGVGASTDHIDVVLAVAVVVFAAIAGDSVGFEVGRHFGDRLLSIGPMKRHRARFDKAQEFLRKRGGPAIFLARFVAFFRATIPALAGSSRMHYPTFVAWNALGGLVWGTGFVLLGFAAGASYAQVEKTAGRGIAVVVAVIVLGALAVWQVRRRRAEKPKA